MPNRETYAQAQKRLLSDLAAREYPTKPNLKVPQASFESDEKHTLYFHAQSVYLDSHSTWIDIRGMSCDTFLNEIAKILIIRRRFSA